MERQNSRKGQESRRFPYNTLDFSLSEQDAIHNDKNKYKKHVHCDKKKYETSQNSYPTSWPAQARMHPFSQRSFSTPDSSVYHYSVPLSFSFEPVSLPIYSALIQPQGNCAVPLEVSNHSRKFRQKKSSNQNGRNKINSSNEVPAIFHTSKLNTGDQQYYTSLPPVNCDVYAPKSSDTEATCKRRFSDPGIGQMSSDDCSTTSFRSVTSSGSSAIADVDSQDFFSLIEQVNELKQNNSHLRKELQETKLELESLKLKSQTWRTDCDDFKPGALSDAISEIRTAVKLSEEALVSKVTQMLQRTTSECKEVQCKLEERLEQEINERLLKLEEKMRKFSQRNESLETTASPEIGNFSLKEDFAIQQQLEELEQEKFQLQRELQEAVTKRKSAEATTEKLERLVGVLRKKINGVSLESSIPDEKQSLVRPLASSLEKNPFIIANNRQGQKSDVLFFHKPKNSPLRAFPQESGEVTNSEGTENKENETGSESSINSPTQTSPETTSITAQVTITGPVTDL